MNEVRERAELRRWIHGWNRFWFLEGPCETLGLLRIFVGLGLLMKLTGATGGLAYLQLDFAFPQPTFENESAWFLGGYRLPFPGFEFLPPLGYHAFGILDRTLLGLALIWTLGWQTRWTGPLLATLFTWRLGHSQFLYHHHVFLLTLVLWILAFSACGRHFSLDAWRAGSRRPLPGTLLPRRMLQVLVSAIYLFAALAKLNSGWFRGDVLDALIDNDQVVGVIGGPLLQSLPPVLFTWGTIAAEFFLAGALWWPRTRKLAFVVGFVLHVGIAMTMEVETFGWTMLALYLAFLDPAGRKSSTSAALP